MADLKILTANCQGLGQVHKRLDLFNYLKSKNCQIYCLQDIHSTINTEALINSEWGNKCLFSSVSSNSRGCAILFNKNLDYNVHSHISDPEGNYIIADITVDNNRFTLITLYGPNKDNPLFFENLLIQAEQYNNEIYILCGDFNIVQDPKYDYYNYNDINNKKAQQKVLEIKESFNLIDPFRAINPTLKRYTWRRKSPCLKQSRFDFFLMSEKLLPSLNMCKIESSYRSDHSMVILNISFNNFKHGKGLWKHNNSLLNDINYLNTINNKIEEIKMQYALPVYNLNNIEQISNDKLQFIIDDQLFLETLLMEIRGKSISYASFKKKEKDKLEKELINKINNLDFI